MLTAYTPPLVAAEAIKVNGDSCLKAVIWYYQEVMVVEGLLSSNKIQKFKRKILSAASFFVSLKYFRLSVLIP